MVPGSATRRSGLSAGSLPATAYTPPVGNPSGTIGHYDFRDHASGSHDGDIDCDYGSPDAHDIRWLKQFVIRIPWAWWPDTSSNSSTQHGTVGWRFRVQQTSHVVDGATWTTAYQSSIQKRTAHEDHPSHDDADKAPFTTRTLSWSSDTSVSYRIKVTIYWYRADGSVRGQVDHWYEDYDSSLNHQTTLGYCRNKQPTIHQVPWDSPSGLAPELDRCVPVVESAADPLRDRLSACPG